MQQVIINPDIENKGLRVAINGLGGDSNERFRLPIDSDDLSESVVKSEIKREEREQIKLCREIGV